MPAHGGEGMIPKLPAACMMQKGKEWSVLIPRVGTHSVLVSIMPLLLCFSCSLLNVSKTFVSSSSSPPPVRVVGTLRFCPGPTSLLLSPVAEPSHPPSCFHSPHLLMRLICIFPARITSFTSSPKSLCIPDIFTYMTNPFSKFYSFSFLMSPNL